MSRAKVTMAGDPESEAAVEEPEVEEVEEELVEEDEYEDLADVTPLEEMDPSQPAWEDGPLVGDLQRWKEEYGDVYVTYITPEFPVVWRPMTRREYKTHVHNIETLSQSGNMGQIEMNLFNEESLTTTCLLWPELNISELDRGLAGLPSLIAQQVMEASGFVAVDVRQL